MTFFHCTQLADVNLGEGVEEIRAHAFGLCASLQRLFIPSTVKVIEDSAFRGCPNLVSIVFSDEIKHLRDRRFDLGMVE